MTMVGRAEVGWERVCVRVKTGLVIVLMGRKKKGRSRYKNLYR